MAIKNRGPVCGGAKPTVMRKPATVVQRAKPTVARKPNVVQRAKPTVMRVKKNDDDEKHNVTLKYRLAYKKYVRKAAKDHAWDPKKVQRRFHWELQGLKHACWGGPVFDRPSTINVLGRYSQH